MGFATAARACVPQATLPASFSVLTRDLDDGSSEVVTALSFGTDAIVFTRCLPVRLKPAPAFGTSNAAETSIITQRLRQAQIRASSASPRTSSSLPRPLFGSFSVFVSPSALATFLLYSPGLALDVPASDVLLQLESVHWAGSRAFGNSGRAHKGVIEALRHKIRSLGLQTNHPPVASTKATPPLAQSSGLRELLQSHSASGSGLTARELTADASGPCRSRGAGTSGGSGGSGKRSLQETCGDDGRDGKGKKSTSKRRRKSEDPDGDGENPKEVTRAESWSIPGTLRVACPFAIRYPRHYVHCHAACVNTIEVDRLKEHFKRHHSAKKRCPFCTKDVPDWKDGEPEKTWIDAYVLHIRVHKAHTPKVFKGHPHIMSYEQELAVADGGAFGSSQDRRPNEDSRGPKWRDCWGRLFPDAAYVPDHNVRWEFSQVDYLARLMDGEIGIIPRTSRSDATQRVSRTTTGSTRKTTTSRAEESAPSRIDESTEPTSVSHDDAPVQRVVRGPLGASAVPAAGSSKSGRMDKDDLPAGPPLSQIGQNATFDRQPAPTLEPALDSGVAMGQSAEPDAEVGPSAPSHLTQENLSSHQPRSSAPQRSCLEDDPWAIWKQIDASPPNDDLYGEQGEFPRPFGE